MLSLKMGKIIPAWTNVAWTGTDWDALWWSIDLSDYQKKLVEWDWNRYRPRY